MGTHARIAPSSLAMTVACNASVQMQERAEPLPESDEEAEGTAAHLVAMWAAAGKLMDLDYRFESGGRTWEVDIDMRNGARLYAETMRGDAGGDLRLEDPVRCSHIHEIHCTGTPDAWRYFERGFGPQGVPVLRIGEYKYGHRYVEVFENFQMIAYAVGVMERLSLSDDNLIIEFVLTQPRAYHKDGPVRWWRVNAVELRGLVNIASHAAHAALLENPTAATGLHCLDCKARHMCATLKHLTGSILDYSQQAELQPLDNLALGQELRILDKATELLKARRTGIAAQIEAKLRKGEQIPFYGLEAGRSNIRWKDNTKTEDIAILGDMLNVSIRKPLEVFTPRQAIDAGIDEAIVMLYAHRPPGALSLKPILSTAVRKAFGATQL